jgi:hypothetical protein
MGAILSIMLIIKICPKGMMLIAARVGRLFICVHLRVSTVKNIHDIN